MVPRVGVLQGGCSVEHPPSSKCPAPGRGDDLKEPICDGIGLDDEWKYWRIRQGKSGCKPDQARRFSPLESSHPRFIDDYGTPQLEGVAKGLIYIHDQGMIHADLKGVRLYCRNGASILVTSMPIKANILIDHKSSPRLADFGLLTMTSEPTILLASSSHGHGGTARWMSPELIDPEQFGFDKYCPTKASDCYALGMVIYETISGRLPFHQHTDLNVFFKVVRGERPRRGRDFTDGVWKVLELCWKPQPNDRPNIEDVLVCLKQASNLSESKSKASPVDEGTGNGDEDPQGMQFLSSFPNMLWSQRS